MSMTSLFTRCLTVTGPQQQLFFILAYCAAPMPRKHRPNRQVVSYRQSQKYIVTGMDAQTVTSHKHYPKVAKDWNDNMPSLCEILRIRQEHVNEIELFITVEDEAAT